jgi:hypothetical protein
MAKLKNLCFAILIMFWYEMAKLNLLCYSENKSFKCISFGPVRWNIYWVYFIFSFHIKNHPFFFRFRQDALIYCIVAKSYDEQTKLDKKSSTVRKNEMHLIYLTEGQMW